MPECIISSLRLSFNKVKGLKLPVRLSNKYNPLEKKYINNSRSLYRGNFISVSIGIVGKSIALRLQTVQSPAIGPDPDNSVLIFI